MLSRLSNRVRHLVLLISILACPSVISDESSPEVKSEKFSYETQIGLVFTMRDNQACMAIHNTDIKSETRMIIIEESPFDKTQSIVEGIVIGKDCGREFPGREAAVDGDGPEMQYAVEVRGRVDQSLGVFGFGIIGVSESAFTILNNVVRSDLDGDGKSEYFFKCASHEGVHFDVLSSPIHQGNPHWHAYYHLDYDTEPSCPDISPEPY